MYAKSTRPSAKREVQKERSAKRDVQKFRSAQRAMRMCPRSGQIFFIALILSQSYSPSNLVGERRGSKLMTFFQMFRFKISECPDFQPDPSGNPIIIKTKSSLSTSVLIFFTISHILKTKFYVFWTLTHRNWSKLST